MKNSITLWMTIALVVFFSSYSWAAKTYLTTANVDVYDEPNGEIIQSWPSHTLFTSNKEDNLWIRVSGHFPEGEWQSVSPMWYVKASENVSIQKPQSSNAPATIFHIEEDELGNNKKGPQAYRLLEQTTVFNRLGEALEVWPEGKSFTSAYENEDALKVTGHFPNGSSWKAMPEPVWIIKPVRLQNRTQPKPIARKENTKRLVIIDKSAFNITVYEQTPNSLESILTAPVALGYDRCLPKSQGGKCYYTPEGEFEIEFKLFDTDGIKWCIPKKMEAEFSDKIARGERCWRGIMGQHALHFGDSLFLHGTSNPNSIGSRTTHGCVRLRNSDIEWVYRLLENGDKVIITSNKEETVANLQDKQLEALANVTASNQYMEATKTKEAEVNAPKPANKTSEQEN